MERSPALLVATTNSGKVREFTELLAQSHLQIHTPHTIPAVENLDVEETGETFQENALLKATAFAQLAKVLTVADDSGLEIKALNGQPGVRSKRFAPGSDADRNQKVLELLKGVTDREARFVTVLCLLDPATQETQYFEGEVKGRIGHEAKGTDGFGYDPLFIPEGHEKSLAELGQEVKNQLSHRARAIQLLNEYLRLKYA